MTSNPLPPDPASTWNDELRKELERIGEPVELEAGQDLFRRGDASDAMYVLTVGRLEVVSQISGSEEHLLGVVEAGGYVGETALVREGQRTATVRALEPCRLVRVLREDLSELEQEHAVLRGFLAGLVRRRMPSLRMVTSPLFEGLDSELISDLEGSFEWLTVHGGTRLFGKGDAPDALYLLVHGRLRVLFRDADDRPERAIDLGRGEVVGEMALITGETRTADVWVLRDSELLRLAQADFDRILAQHPTMYRPLLRSVVTRLREDQKHERSQGSPDRTLVLLPLGRRPVDRGLVRDLIAALGRCGSLLHLDRARFEDLHGLGSSQTQRDDRRFIHLTEWLDRQEDEHDFVLYEAEPEPSEWTQRCLRQADRVLLVGHAEDFGELGPNADLAAFEEAEGPSRSRTLVLVQPARSRAPVGTAAWLDHFEPESHHHVALDDPRTTMRLARILTGRSVGVVLGGGGARGFAHIGVLRAIRELNLDVDHIGGTSTGAILSSIFAAGSSIEEMIRLNELAFVESGMHRAWNWPMVSVLSGQIPARHVDARFGEGHIEDLWTDFFCISTNLTRAQIKVHRRGRIADAVLSSVAMPALFPPLFEDGDVLVDGGVANNLPIDLMREICQGPILASDVSPELSVQANHKLVRCPSMLRVLADRLLRRDPWKGLPRLGEIVRRTIEYSSVVQKNEMRRQADLYLTPPIEHISLLEGIRIREIEAIGYEYAKPEIERFLEERSPP